MANHVALTFKNRFKLAFDQSGTTSYSELSRLAGLSRPMTQKIISGAFDHSTVGPGVFSIKRLADAMGTTVSFLMGEDLASNTETQEFFNGSTRSKGIFEKLMETHWRGAGRYEAFDKLIEDCDVFHLPEPGSEIPRIKRVGKRTLFAGRLGGPFLSDAQSEINAMSQLTRLDIIKFQNRVVEEGSAIGNTFLDHDMATRPARVRASNSRLGLLVENHQGDRSILLHAMPIPV